MIGEFLDEDVVNEKRPHVSERPQKSAPLGRIDFTVGPITLRISYTKVRRSTAQNTRSKPSRICTIEDTCSSKCRQATRTLKVDSLALSGLTSKATAVSRNLNSTVVNRKFFVVLVNCKRFGVENLTWGNKWTSSVSRMGALMWESSTSR